MGKFLIKPVKTGVVFHLIAANGKTIGTSQPYKSIESCKKGIESVKNNGGASVEDQTKEGFTIVSHPKYELYVDKANEFRFRLLARNGEEILASQGYTTKESCEKGIASVHANAADASIEEGE